MNLNPFFNPKSIIIIGASRNEFTFNWTLVKNLREARYKGKISIIHPEAEDILGVKCYKSLEQLPEDVKPELAIILLGKSLKETTIALADFGVKYMMIESDFSANPEQGNIIKNLKEIAVNRDLFIMGPAMIGIINTDNYFNSSVIPVRRHIVQKHRKHREQGSLSYLAQSGGLSGALGWWTSTQSIPISKIVHTGIGINVDEADALQYLFDDSNTKVISICVQKPNERFIEILTKNSSKKPVLYKMIGKDQKIIEDLKNSGAIEVDSYIELFEFAKIFLWCPPPKGSALGIIGPSSGAIRLITTEMIKNGLHLAQLNPITKETILSKVGGSTCIQGNPIDYWPPKKFIGTDVCSVYYKASNLLLDDESVDGLFLALEFFSEIEFDFEIFKEIKEKFPNKPIITVLVQAELEGVKRIVRCATKLQIPVFIDEVERSIRGYSALLQYYSRKEKKIKIENKNK
ncbi:MAG: hypothetical protein GY870_10555 [archaeon]|nr:hypothetical protein [archaeon]